MSEKSKTYIIRMLDMIRKIESYSKDIKTFDDFQSNEMIIDAVITPLTQLGEISNQISKLNYKPFDTQLPLREMNEMRNFLVHTYHKIELEYIRQVVKIHIPELKKRLEKL